MLQLTKINDFHMIDTKKLSTRDKVFAKTKILNTYENEPMMCYGKVDCESPDSSYVSSRFYYYIMMYWYDITNHIWKRIKYMDNTKISYSSATGINTKDLYFNNVGYFCGDTNISLSYYLCKKDTYNTCNRVKYDNDDISCDEIFKINEDTMLIKSNYYLYTLTLNNGEIVEGSKSKICNQKCYKIISLHMANNIITILDTYCNLIKINLNTLDYTVVDIGYNDECATVATIYDDICYYAKDNNIYAVNIKEPEANMKVAETSNHIAKLWCADNCLCITTIDNTLSDPLDTSAELFVSPLITNLILNREDDFVDYGNKNSTGSLTDIMYVTKDGEAFYGGSINVNNKFIVDKEGNVTLPSGSGIKFEGDKSFTDITQDAIKTGGIEANTGEIGGWSIDTNCLKSTNTTDATNIYFYSSAEKTDNKTPILIVKKGSETSLGIYDTGYILGKKLRIENPDGDTSIGKFLFKTSKFEGIVEGVDYSNAFDDLSDALGDETGDGSETVDDDGEDEVVWGSKESVRNGVQALSNGTTTASGLYVGCKTGDGGSIAGFSYSNFWVNLAGTTNTRGLCIYDDVYMYAKTKSGKRSKKKVFRFAKVTDNSYRLKIGNLNETSTYKCELNFTKSTSGTYIQVHSKKFDISNCKTFDRGSATVSGTSDENVKVLYDYDDRYDKFYMNLKPLLYKYNMSDDYHRKHAGFGARAVEQALIDAGLTNEEFGAVCIQNNVTIGIQGGATKSYDELYGLNYNEFIGLNTYMIQKLYKRIEELEKKIDEAGI